MHTVLAVLNVPKCGLKDLFGYLILSFHTTFFACLFLKLFMSCQAVTFPDFLKPSVSPALPPGHVIRSLSHHPNN